MDGTDRRVVLQLTSKEKCHDTWPNQLELDYTTEQLVWVDGYIDKLQSVGVDGDSHRELLSNITYCFGLGIDGNGDMYYTSWNKQDYSLWRWNSRTPNLNISILRNLPSRPMDVAVVRRNNRASGRVYVYIVCKSTKFFCSLLNDKHQNKALYVRNTLIEHSFRILPSL